MKANKRNIQMTVRLTQEEQQTYTKLATTLGTTLADLFRISLTSQYSNQIESLKREVTQ